MQQNVLLDYLNELLKPELFNDYCPNGLQVEGKKEINNIVAGVTACQALLDAAINKKADLVLVHHGYFWKGERAAVTSVKRQRLKKLLANDINLIAYHLPLDSHDEFGNNIQLARILDLNIDGEIDTGSGPNLMLYGDVPNALSTNDFSRFIAKRLNREPLLIAGGDHDIKTVAWCTGAAQDFIELAADQGVDAYVSGEVSERTAHMARELGVHYFACGHHATERYGVKSLAEHLQQTFDLTCEFIDIDNPV